MRASRWSALERKLSSVKESRKHGWDELWNSGLTLKKIFITLSGLCKNAGFRLVFPPDRGLRVIINLQPRYVCWCHVEFRNVKKLSKSSST